MRGRLKTQASIDSTLCALRLNFAPLRETKLHAKAQSKNQRRKGLSLGFQTCSYGLRLGRVLLWRGSPFRHAVGAALIGQIDAPRAVSVDDINAADTVAPARESETRAVGRPFRGLV